MGALIQYYSLAAKRRKKQELLRQAAEAASKDKNLGEAQTLVEVITPITPNMTFPLKGSQPEAQPEPAQAPQTPPPIPQQTAQQAEGENDVIGTWIITMGNSYVKIPIKSVYTLVVGKKKESIRSGEERNERPSLAIMASWGVLKKNSSFRKKMPKNMAYILKKGDPIELDSALSELEDNFLKMGSAYYMQVGSEGRMHLYSNKIPPYWDSFISELDGKGLIPSGSVRLRKPQTLVISVGGKNVPLKFSDVAALVRNHSITHFDILRRYITTGRREAHHDDGNATHATANHHTIFDDPAKFAQADLHWMTINLVNEIRSHINASWESGSYTKEGEIHLRNQVEEYLADKTLQIKNTAEGIAKKSRPEAFKYIQQQTALVSKVRSVISEWNDLFHSEKTKGWSSPKYAIPVTEAVLTEAQLDKLLMEVTFRKLMDLTQRNGNYKIGGLVKIGNSWVTDPRVKGRVQNSMFVVTKPPTWKQDTDGLTRIDYNFKSRPDRSTTGMRQKGYIKFIPPGFLKRMIQKIKGLIKKQPKEGPDSDVHCFCTCPDFKYRWHKVLADKGASHTPTGQGGEATNQPPNITNPTRSLSLCKHLAAMAGYLATTQRDVTDYVSNKQKNTVPVAPNVAPKVVSGASVDSST